MLQTCLDVSTSFTAQELRKNKFICYNQRKINSHTHWMFQTSFTTSDKNTFLTNNKGKKINFSHLQKSDKKMFNTSCSTSYRTSTRNMYNTNTEKNKFSDQHQCQHLHKPEIVAKYMQQQRYRPMSAK